MIENVKRMQSKLITCTSRHKSDTFISIEEFTRFCSDEIFLSIDFKHFRSAMYYFKKES